MQKKTVRRNKKYLSVVSKTSLKQVKQIRKLFAPGDHLLILIEPDPDSISSAMALKRLLWKQVQRITISYQGVIQRLENQAMVDILRIPLVRFDDIDPDVFNRKALVDSQPHHQEIFSLFEYDLVIDHHPIVRQVSASYVDIRPEYGATATIMIEYLRAAKIRPSERLSTALLYAIKTDTRNFERHAALEDIEQFQYVFTHRNQNLIKKIESSEMKISDLAFYRKAFENMSILKQKVFVHIGKVETPDICVQIADFFMRVYMISWSFVSGSYDEKLIVILRSDGIRKDAGRHAIKAFKPFGVAGGHKAAARAEIQLEVLKEHIPKLTSSHIEDFIRKRLGL